MTQGVGDNSTCTVTGRDDTSMVIKWHLAGFHFLTAADIEARVIPQLSQNLHRQDCHHVSSQKGATQAQKLKACCLKWNESDPVNAACTHPTPIDSLDAFCLHQYPDVGSTDYEECKKVASFKDYMMFKAARRNWVKTLERNYVSCSSTFRCY